MGFIQRVQERTSHSQDFDAFKRLWPAYKLVDSVGVTRPKVYITMPKEEVANINWDMLRHRVPNLFTLRPSMFINRAQDFLLRDDGMRGLMNFSYRNIQPPQEALKAQQGFLNSMPDDTALMVEEFPLTYDNVLCYPAHYMVHTFGGVVGCIQGGTNTQNFWMDTECKVSASQDQSDVSNLIPNVGVMDDLCSASKAISLATGLPYVRIDFVASTRGAMFRSFACAPGDVRSNDHNWFYKKHDDAFGELWEQAERALVSTHQPPIATKDEANADSEKSRARVAPPDDNA